MEAGLEPVCEESSGVVGAAQGRTPCRRLRRERRRDKTSRKRVRVHYAKLNVGSQVSGGENRVTRQVQIGPAGKYGSSRE